MLLGEGRDLLRNKLGKLTGYLADSEWETSDDAFWRVLGVALTTISHEALVNETGLNLCQL